MKKKLLALAMATVMAFSFHATAFATSLTEDGSGSSTLTYHAESSFCVMIPATVSLNSGSATFTSTEMTLCDGQKVAVSLPSADFTLTNEQGDTITGYFMVEALDERLGDNSILGYFENEYIGDMTWDFLYHLDSKKAGDFTGTTTFSISLVQ